MKKRKIVLIILCVFALLFTGCAGGWRTALRELLEKEDPLLIRAEQALGTIPEDCQKLVTVEKQELAGQSFEDYLIEKLNIFHEQYQYPSTDDVEIVCYVDSLAMGTWVMFVEVSDRSAITVPGRYLYVSPAAPEEGRVVYEIASPMPGTYWNTYIRNIFTQETIYLNGEAIESVLFEPLLYTKGWSEADEEYSADDWLDERLPENVRFMAVFPVGTFQVDMVEFPKRARGEGPILRRFPRGDSGTLGYGAVEEVLQVCEGQILSDMDVTSMSEKEIADLATESDLTLEDYQVYHYVDYPYIAGKMDAEEAGAIPLRTFARVGVEEGILNRMESVAEKDALPETLTQIAYFAWDGKEYRIDFWGLGVDYQESTRGLSLKKGSGYESYYRYSSSMLWRLAEALGYDLSGPDYSWKRLPEGGTLWRDEAADRYTYCQDIGTGELLYVEVNRTGGSRVSTGGMFRIAAYKEGDDTPVCEYSLAVDADALPFFEDLNSDGYLDLSIESSAATYYSLWKHYLWSPSKQTYVEAPGLVNGVWSSYRVDQENRRISLGYRFNQSERYAEVYRWEGESELVWMGGYECSHVNDDEAHITVSILLDGEKQVVTDAVYDYWAYRYDWQEFYGTDILLDWAEANILWYADIEDKGQVYSLYYAQNILRDGEEKITGYQDRVWITDGEKKLVKYKEFFSDSPCSEAQWTESGHGQGLAITYEDGSRQEYSLTQLLIREYADWTDIMHDRSQPYVDGEIFEIIRSAYEEVDYFGEFKTGDLETYDFYIEKFDRLLQNEVPFLEPESGKTYYMEEYNDTWRHLDMRPELREEYDVNNFIYYFFDMDDDGTPELGVREASLGAYVLCFFKYEEDRDEYRLWYSYDSASWYDLLGTKKVAWNHDGNKFAFYQLDESGREDEPECHTFFFEGYISEKDTVRMVGLPQYADKSKEIEVTEEMMRQGSYARYSDEWFFRVTEEQFNAIAKPYWEANRLANEKEKECLYTYEELFGGLRP